MDLERLWKSAKTEAEWLRYYGHAESRNAEEFKDEKFYDRIISIGYTKVVTSLDLRCAMGYITSNKPIFKSDLSDLFFTSGPRNHLKNIYTPLEYFFIKQMGKEQLIKIIKGE